MIAYLQGTLVGKGSRQVILLVGGVGYSVHVGTKILEEVSDQQELKLFIFTQVREDAITLFGFREESELRFFERLISVSGIGAKTAMHILEMPAEKTKRALVAEDVSYLTHIPGLGKKTASRLILELKGKITIDNLPSIEKKSPPGALMDEAMEALTRLGYDKVRVIRFINETPDQFESAEELITTFLKNV